MDFRHPAVTLGRWLWPSKGASARFGPGQIGERFGQPDDRWLNRLVGRADGWLRQWHGVREFTSHRTCLFRIAPAQAPRKLTLQCGRTIHAGDRVIELHLWNEHFLRIPPGGPNLAWAKLIRRRFRDSLCDLALYLERSPELSSVVAIWACGAIAPARNGGKLARICESYGFEAFPSPGRNAAERLLDWFFDFWIVMLVSAFNPRSLTAELVFRPRYEIWMSRETLLERFGRYGTITRAPRHRERKAQP